MAAEDYFPDLHWDHRYDDPDDYDDGMRFPKNWRSRWCQVSHDKTCNGCGTRHLVWSQGPNGEWRLYDTNGDRHMCASMMREYPDVDDFEDLTGDLS